MIISSVSHISIDPNVPSKSHSQVRAVLSLLAFLKVCPGRHLSTVMLTYVTGTCQYTLRDKESWWYAYNVAIKLTSETSTFTAAKTAMVKFFSEVLFVESAYVNSINLSPGKYSLIFGSRKTSFYV